MSSLILSALIQIVLGLCLALLLVSLCVRKHPGKRLKYWILSWAILFLYTMSGFALLLIHVQTPPGSTETLLTLPARLFGSHSTGVDILAVIFALGITFAIVLAVINDARISERRLSVYWAAAHDGMILIDAEGIILKVNEAFCRLIGKERGDLEKHPFTVCLGRDEGESSISRFKLNAARRQIGQFQEMSVTFWDGSRHCLEVTIAFVDARPLNTYVISVRDVTMRRQTEDALKESERRFRELLSSVKLAGVILDTAGNVTFCNDYLLHLTGWTAAEVQGRNWISTFIPERERQRIHEVFGNTIAGKASAQYHENEIVTRDGASKLIQWTNTVLRDTDGRIVGSASLGTDVTEHRQLEERYRQAQKIESIGSLAGGIAHDFNNLLTVINGYGEVLLSKTNKMDPLYEGLDEIKHAGEKASALTQQLLAFSRKQVLQPKLLDLNQVIADVCRMLSRLIGEDIELVTRLDPDLGPVYADEGQIHQVLMNLSVNARDAMPEGGKLEITSANVEITDGLIDPLSGIQPGMYASIVLTDTGTGMSEEVKSHLFEPFFTTKERDKGTGLGLSTVYGIVRQSGGQITVTSEVGKGTSFQILLPRAKDAELGPTLPKIDHAPYRGTETILLVEDQAEVRKIAAETLRGFGYQILEADSGGQALQLSEHHEGPIDLVVTDLIMPGMTGRTLADQLKHARPEIRVLYMSGYTDRGDIDQAQQDSGTAYVQKPFTPHELATKVGDFLAGENGHARILVVDDELSIRMLLRKILQGAGYEVIEAANGRAALSKIREGKVDLIITDLVMPEQEGVETIRRLRESHPQIKVVAMSGAFGGRLLQTAELLGAQATLMKPVSPAILLQVTHDLLRGC